MNTSISPQILAREVCNQSCIHLYLHPEGNHWEAYRQSAMFLKEIIPDVALSEIHLSGMKEEIVRACVTFEQIEQHDELLRNIELIGDEYMKIG